MNMFTLGQKTRMISAINQYRPALLTQEICGNGVSEEDVFVGEKKPLKIVDILGREVTENKRKSVLYL